MDNNQETQTQIQQKESYDDFLELCLQSVRPSARKYFCSNDSDAAPYTNDNFFVKSKILYDTDAPINGMESDEESDD